MLNQVILVGRTSSIDAKEDGAVLTLRTEQKVYGCDEVEKNDLDVTVPSHLWQGLRTIINTDMVIGLKARLRNEGKLLVVVEKVTVINKTKAGA